MRAKVQTKNDIAVWLGGSLGEGLKIETLHISSSKDGLMTGEIKLWDGTTGIQVQFLNVTYKNNGKKVTVVNKEIGND
jgi:hypothetical protein